MMYTLLTVFCALLLLHIRVDAYNYVPVVNFLSKAEGDGSKLQSIAICKEIGGFLVTEATQSIHDEVINQAKNLGVGEEWYSFLGADTLTINPINCKPDSLVATTSFDSNCMWRWNQGRWINLPDPESEMLKEDHMGVTFFKGNNYFMTDIMGKGPVQGFPIWFQIDRSQIWTTLRPNVLTLRHLIAVGSNEGSTWSDNNETGGYTYANYNFESQNRGDAAHLDLNAMAASRSKFVTVCNAYTPDRATMEQYNTTSGLQLYWWGILLAFLIVLCVITFIVVAACQEREDMDEPPEDAPEWAEEQQENVKRTKSFVSTRSFRKYDDEDNDLDNSSNKNNDENTHNTGYNMASNAENENMYNVDDNFNQRPSFRNGNQNNYTTNPLLARNPSVSEQMNPRQPMQNNWV